MLERKGSDNNKGVSCDKCQKVFTQKRNLKQHTKSVHEKNVQYTCNICKYSSFWAKDLKRHIEVIHKRSNRKGLAVQRRKSINKMSTRHKQRLTKSFLEHSALSENIRKEISDKVALSKLKGTQKLVNEQDAINMIQNANLSDRSVLKIMSPLRKNLVQDLLNPT